MDIAQHVRIFEKMPTDELVEKRTVAIGALAEKYGGVSHVAELLQLAADLTKGVSKGNSLPELRMTEVEEAIRETSSSFVRDGQAPQLLACALMAVLKLLNEASPTSGDWSRRDVVAIGLWSGLGFQVPRSEERLEALRFELLETARNLVLRSAGNARKRMEVPEIIVKVPDGGYDPTKLGKVIQNGAANVIDALRLNAALDREEIDLLWWVLGGWCKIAKKPYSSMSQISAVITAGLEAGSVVRRMPDEAHKHLVLRLLKEDETVSMQDIMQSLKHEREQIAAFFSTNTLLGGREPLFPLVAACVAGKVDGKGAGARELKLSEWAARALLESSILRVGTLSRNLV